MFPSETLPLELNLSLTHLEFIKKWRFYIKMAPIDRVRELQALCQDHLLDPKVQEIIPLIDERLNQE